MSRSPAELIQKGISKIIYAGVLFRTASLETEERTVADKWWKEAKLVESIASRIRETLRDEASDEPDEIKDES